MKTQNITTDIYLPTLILKNTILMPSITIPVMVTKEIAKNAIRRALEKDGLVFVTTLKEGKDLEQATGNDFFQVGTLCKIEKTSTNQNGEFIATIRSIDRYRLLTINFEEAFSHWASTIEILPDLYDLDRPTEEALLKNLKEISYDILKLINANDEFTSLINRFSTVAEFTNVICQNLPIIISKKQEILEIQSIKNRALKVLEILVEQRELFKVNSEMGVMISEKTSKAYRESILREQLNAIRKELGEDQGASYDDESGEKLSLKDRILKANLPKDVEKVALQQLSRYESMGQQNAESHVIKNYIELILSMPWNKIDESEIDLEKAQSVLEEEHYGLEKIKKHIIQHLAVMKLSPKKKGSIILLVGPPGVGKTSLGQSIAKSLNRKYVRASLGGVRDDSEIRGHRRTYVGAMPGRIIEAIKRAESKNPVFVLDEIDKLGKGYGGDPAAALLEVLDPEQNQTFMDHYLDLPFDLSNVFFIATANSLESIPLPLLDRMEIIQLSGYTAEEKFHIAKNHLLTKAFEDHGVSKERIVFSDDNLQYIINEYTRESGVRELKRKIEKVIRSLAVDLVKNPESQISLNEEMIIEILGPSRNRNEEALKVSVPGVVTGLAWTPVGGDILFIETLKMPGNGKIQLTGKLGEVMSESAHIGLSLVKSKLANHVMYNGETIDFSKLDFHIHVPSGSIPKDGPSAGITMFTALCSLVLNKPVDPKIAMTGEITLRGAVMPVGGIKEKLIAAHRAGIKKIIMSKKNEIDVKEIPSSVKDELQIVYVENINELLNEVFGKSNSMNAPELLISPQINDQRGTNAICAS